MYSDLFDQLGRGVGGRSSVGNEPAPPLVSFKAGKIIMTLLEESKEENNNGESVVTKDEEGSGLDGSKAPKLRYQCVADTARGEVRLIHADDDRVVHPHPQHSQQQSMGGGTLQWQWYDRRAQTVKETFRIREGSTFERIELPPNTSKLSDKDRVYVWTMPKKDATHAHEMEYRMYWMQDADPSEDDEIVASVNQYLAEAGDAGEMTAAAAATMALGTNAATATNGASSQVDALSSILENLGIPAQSETTTAAATSATTGRTTNQLTLADLQGAMAGIAQQQQSSMAEPGPLLEDIVTQPAIEALLQDEGARQRLVALLPEGQQSEEFLRANLQSPQLQATLRALTRALLPDDNGELSGYASVIANFQLDPNAGQDSLAAGNPLQAFLDCVVASAAKETEEGKDDNAMDEEKEAE
jgi:26S proteasome regulatory subunit N13